MLLMNDCFYYVRFSFFSTKSSERLVSNMSEMTYVCVEWVAKP